MAPPDEDSPRFVAYQVAELMKHVDKFEAQVFARFDALENRMSSLEFLRKDVYDTAHKALEEKVDANYAAIQRKFVDDSAAIQRKFVDDSAAVQAKFADVYERIDSVKSIAMWALSGVITVVVMLGSLAAVIKVATG
jgi:hypothetical protein